MEVTHKTTPLNVASRLSLLDICFFLLFAIAFIFPLLDPTRPVLDFQVTPAAKMLQKYAGILSPLSLFQSTVILLSYLAIITLGFVLSTPLYRITKISTPLPIRWMASFAVGYFSTVSVARISSFVVPPKYFFLMTFLILVAFIIGIGFFQYRKSVKISLRISNVPISLVLFLALVFLLVVNIRSYQGHFWTGHSEDKFANFLLQLKTSGAAFPIIRTHYEEALFNFFLYSARSIHLHPVLFFWMTNSLGKLSALCLVYIILRQWKANKITCFAVISFLALGSHTLHYGKYQFLFDSGNPLYVVLHPGRYLWVVLLVFFVPLFGLTQNISLKDKTCLIVTFILLGFSLPATSIHNLLIVLTTLFVCVLVNYSSQQVLFEEWFFIFLAFAAVGCGFAYEWKKAGDTILVASTIAALYSIFVLFRSSLHRGLPLLLKKFQTRLLLVLIFSATLSLFTSGNLLTDFLHQHGIQLLSHMQFLDPFTEGRPPLPSSLNLSGQWINSFHVIGNPEYSLDARRFYSFLGLSFFAIFSALLFLKEIHKKEKDALSRLWTWMLLLSAGMLPLFFLYIDFINDIQSYLKTRFLEFPIYLGWFGLAYALTTTSTGEWPTWIQRSRMAFLVLLILHAFSPIFYQMAWLQWEENVKFLLGVWS